MVTRVKELWKQHKNELIVGVVVSLLTAFIMQSGSWLVMTAPTMGSSLRETLKNVIFTNAASQSHLNSLSMILSFCFSFLIWLYIFMTQKFFSRLLEEHRTKKMHELLEKVNSSDPKVQEEAIKKLYKTSKIFVEKNAKDKEKKQSVKIWFWLFFILTVFLSTYTQYFLIYPLNLADKFQRDIIAITPYSDNHTIQCLESDWVCMRSENEYKEIYKVIDAIKQTNSLP